MKFKLRNSDGRKNDNEHSDSKDWSVMVVKYDGYHNGVDSGDIVA